MENSLRVFFVDPDTSLMANLPVFEQDGFDIEVFRKASTCKERLLEIQPDILILDIALPDMDGIALCREIKDDFMTQDIPVILMSKNGDIETQMACYDAGGEDFIHKPIESAQLQQKLRIASRIIREKQSLSHQASYATKTAMSAMSSMGELGLVLQFMGKSLMCADPESLAGAILDTLHQYDLVGAVQFRLAAGDVTHGEDGRDVPLEVSVLNHARDAGRIFHFKSRCAFNFGALTVLIKNMPIEDEERCGRIRDNIAYLAEAAAERLRTMELEKKAQESRRNLETTLGEIQSALDAVNSNYRRATFELTQTVLEYQEALGQSFVHLGLSEEQELELTATANRYMQQMISKQDESLFVVGQLENIASKLKSSLTPE